MRTDNPFGRGLASLLACGAMIFGVPASAQDATCGRSRETVRIDSIDQRFEILLTDGRRILIAGVETGTLGDQQADRRGTVASWLEGRDAALSPLIGQPDRWGRIVAQIHASDGAGGEISVGYALVDAGLARVKPQPELRGCLGDLFRAEAAARQTRQGLWVDPAWAVRNTADPSTFRDRTGEWLLIQGRIRSVNETRGRAYLNFGPSRSVDLAVTIPRQSAKSFERAGMVLKSLSGKIVRVRGLLETRFGPRIEIDMPEAIEVIADRQTSPEFRGRRQASP